MLIVVTGPPGAGRSSYIKAHAKPQDIVIDLDLMALAMAGPGADGEDGADGVGAPGPTGAPGTDGQSVVGPKGDTGPAGTLGADGKDGAGGKGADGQTCPDGYSLQAPPDDPDALVCRRCGAEAPSSGQSRNPHGLLGLGALTATAMYRRLDGRCPAPSDAAERETADGHYCRAAASTAVRRAVHRARHPAPRRRA